MDFRTIVLLGSTGSFEGSHDVDFEVSDRALSQGLPKVGFATSARDGERVFYREAVDNSI